MNKTLTLTIFILTLYSFHCKGQANSLTLDEFKAITLNQTLVLDELVDSNDATLLINSFNDLEENCNTLPVMNITECVTTGNGIKLLFNENDFVYLKISAAKYSLNYRNQQISVGDNYQKLASIFSKDNLSVYEFYTEANGQGRAINFIVNGSDLSLVFIIKPDNTISEFLIAYPS